MEIALDVKDRKILSVLDLNARASYAEIGKQVRLSKQLVEYRIHNLLKREVIENFVPIINSLQLGYLYCRIWVTLQNCTLEQKRDIIANLTNDQKVFWLFEMQGSFDIFFGCWQKNIEEFQAYVGNFMDKYGVFIRRKTESVATHIHFFPQRYILDNKSLGIVMKTEQVSYFLDEVDKKILDQICLDGRKSLVQIGACIGEHPRVVAYRLRKMEKGRIILGYRAVINYSALGYTYYKVFINLNKYMKSEVSAVKRFIQAHTAVIYLVDGINLTADIDCEVMVKNTTELFAFINELRETFPQVVGDYSTVVFMKAYKTQFLPWGHSA